MSDHDLRARMDNIRGVIAKSAQVMPEHMQFIADNCAAA
jgi:tryptophan halogenase